MFDELINKTEEKVQNIFKNIEDIAYFNSKKVLDAFWSENISEIHFNGTTGYG